MAGYDHVHRVLRSSAVVVVAAACVIGLAPGGATAAPADTVTDNAGSSPTVAQVQREIATLGHQLDTVIERYNGAVLRLGEARESLSAAEAAEAKLDARLRHDRGEFRTVASAAYRAGPLSEVVSMVSSSSPREFLDRLSVLDTLSQRQHRIIDGLREARQRADDASLAARRSAAEAERIAADLDAKKSWISQRIPRQQALLASLATGARLEALDPTGRASRDAARAPLSTAPASGRAAIAVAAAMSKLGSPYVWAAAGPDTFDCSGLMMWAWAQAGVSLPHYSGDQYNTGTRVDRSDLQPGDLVFFYPEISHVGMYIGGGNVIHAPQPGDVVKISSVDSFPYAGATRVG